VVIRETGTDLDGRRFEVTQQALEAMSLFDLLALMEHWPYTGTGRHEKHPEGKCEVVVPQRAVPS
jgi:hypothetical protein